ncbi:alpha/beta hydrolase [Aquibacillus sp. 3ASR75-11]|uniref:Alpha/beta hydrolase n=1 Tax=Terrihalobacillus insolitus TaxID=2950438 RepID=A0A9X3WRI1_9BACI|nr:alpha/beta hydrolase [Terrihalobacillus insolitus]MDC3412969.1 alpha/beta hydrolase [Terrihalobacillus insolitus]MDC3424722.1 alpha/beta hydrolase [Terrihalobacillus insolitus]
MKNITDEKGTTYYEDIGRGIPILFIHPPGMGRKVFEYQKPLANSYRILLPDLSGHGDSVGELKGSIIQTYIDEIKLILNKENIEEVVLVGYSAGGSIAQAFALAHPSKTKALILSGGYPKVDTTILTAEYQIGMSMLKRSPRLLAQIISGSHAKSKSFKFVLYHHMMKSSLRHWYQFYVETFRYNCVKQLPYFTMPLLLIYGSNEFWIKNYKSYYKRCSNYHMGLIPGTSHQVPTKKATAFNDIISHYLSHQLKI